MSAQVVEVEGEVLEKPADEAHAKEMLQRLSNTQHQVHTGDGFSLSMCSCGRLRSYEGREC